MREGKEYDCAVERKGHFECEKGTLEMIYTLQTLALHDTSFTMVKASHALKITLKGWRLQVFGERGGYSPAWLCFLSFIMVSFLRVVYSVILFLRFLLQFSAFLSFLFLLIFFCCSPEHLQDMNSMKRVILVHLLS